MKFEIAECCQCGNEFKRTNPRKTYCSGACRVSAHRDRHGYEQPIFDYPIIRAVELLQEIDVQNLFRIKLYALRYLDSLQKQGKPMPPIGIDMQIFNNSMQLRLAGDEDEEMTQLCKAVEPFTELINIIKKIQETKAIPEFATDY